MPVEILKSHTELGLQNDINDFLAEQPSVEIIDIKFAMATSEREPLYFGAMIIYRTKEDK